MSNRLKEKALLGIYQIAIFIKRLIWRFGHFLFFIYSAIFKSTLLGGAISFLNFYKKLNTGRAPAQEQIKEFVNHPRFLLILNFVFILLLIAPQTTLGVTPEQTQKVTPMIFKLLSPPEEYFTEETIENPIEETIEPWNTGFATPDISTTQEVHQEPGELGTLSLGGGAISKPTLLPGALGADRTETIQYIVQPGDTIGGIAQMFNVSVVTILWENGLSSNSFIKPGQKLNILPTSGLTHTVVKGDTLQSIAKKYKVDVKEITSFNRLTESSIISIGNKLIIPGGQKAQVASTQSTQSAFRRVSAPPPSLNVPAGTNYVWPLGSRRVTQYYSWRHTGLDIGAPQGTAVYAARAGKVTYSQCGWNGGYGCNIRIDHGDGFVTLYAHNSQLFVKVGEEVEQGQTIALSGNTGRSTGPHLHFEVRSGGSRLNPLKYIR